VSVKPLRVLTAVLLVTLVAALRMARAVQVARYADSVVALELVRPARHVMAPGHSLVTSARAVPVPVTNPGLVDTRDAVFTLEFTRQAV
jgi:hypothetical protein